MTLEKSKLGSKGLGDNLENGERHKLLTYILVDISLVDKDVHLNFYDFQA